MLFRSEMRSIQEYLVTQTRLGIPAASFNKNVIHDVAEASALARVLRVKFELGLFDLPYADLMQLNLQEQQGIALKAAEESMVLLKNENKVLPLSANYKNILVVGEDAVECRLGGYSGSGFSPVNMLEGLKQHYEGDVGIEYARGCSVRIQNV